MLKYLLLTCCSGTHEQNLYVRAGYPPGKGWSRSTDDLWKAWHFNTRAEAEKFIDEYRDDFLRRPVVVRVNLGTGEIVEGL